MSSQPARHRDSALQKLLDSHGEMARRSGRDLLASPVSTAITTTVIAIALFLPTLLYLVSLNLNASLGGVRDQARLSVFLELDLSRSESESVSDHLLTLEGISSVEFISASRALEEFSDSAGLGSLLLDLPENPLPATIIVTPESPDPEDIERLALTLEALPAVDAVQFDQLWVQRLQALGALFDRVGGLLLVLVLFGLVAIVGNTVKLAIAQRRQEIRVMKLLGATRAYIARPFLYTGTQLGLAGALLCCLLLNLAVWALSDAVAALGRLYGSEFQLMGLGMLQYLLLLGIGAGIGWLAALLSSFRNIATIGF